MQRYANVLKTFRECLTFCQYISSFNYTHIFIYFFVHVLDIVMDLPRTLAVNTCCANSTLTVSNNCAHEL